MCFFFDFQCLVVDSKCIAWIVLRFYNSISFQRSSTQMPILYHGYATQAVFYCCYLYRSVKMLENSLEMRLCELRSRERERISGRLVSNSRHSHSQQDALVVVCNDHLKDKVDLFNPTFYKLHSQLKQCYLTILRWRFSHGISFAISGYLNHMLTQTCWFCFQQIHLSFIYCYFHTLFQSYPAVFMAVSLWFVLHNSHTWIWFSSQYNAIMILVTKTENLL